MNSPQAPDDPEMALYPWDGGSAGGRLVGMLQDAAQEKGVFFHPQMYLDVFERINVLDRAHWDVGLARRAAPMIHERVAGRVVVVCGRQVQRVMNYDPLPWFVWNAPYDEVRYCVIPHPSGLSRNYNDPAVRLQTGRLLFSLATAYIAANSGNV